MPIEQVRNLLLIALCVVSFLIWQAWQVDYRVKRGEAPSQTSSPPGAQGTTTRGAGTAPADTPSSPPATAVAQPDVPASGVGAALPVQEPPPSTGNRIEVVTDLYRIEIDPVGGGIERLDLLHYPVATDKPNVAFTLMTDDPSSFFVEQSGLISDSPAPTHHARYEAERFEYRLRDGQRTIDLRLTWRDPSGIEVVKTYRFEHDSYIIEVGFEISNGSGEPWAGRMYGQLQRLETNESRSMFQTYTYTGAVISTPEKPYQKYDYDDMRNAPLAVDVDGGWVAMIQHYFIGAWIPAQDAAQHFYSKALEDARYVVGLVAPTIVAHPGSTARTNLRLYVGPKIQERMERAAPHLERTVDYGWLWFIAEPLFWALRWIHGFVNNWGWSIIILTLMIKLAFFHLSATSYKSMARMRKLQPRIVTLRERYASDKQRMNQAMMELYKQEKINPLGGCLPILVQIPVFISLYWMLLESVELRQAPFIWWFDDLSLHDPYFVLPILMGITMLIQQKLNPAPPDPIQAKVMMALPFVFTFFFLFFPSGLVLYWFVNNVLSIIQQWVITRKIVGTA